MLPSWKIVRFSPKRLVKWKVVVFLLGLITLFVIAVLNPPTMAQRPKTKFIFMNKDLCISTGVENNYRRTAVIVVLADRQNVDRRNLIRQTYGSVKNANNVQILAVIFMLGISAVLEETEDKKLEAERDHFGDIIMGDFVDSYRNLTLKTIMAYEWLTAHCREAQIVVKTDDDVLVNVFELTKQLDAFTLADMASSNIWGYINMNEDTVNDTTSRFYASPVDFPSGKFPDHCAGVGYMTTFSVIERIVYVISISYPGRVCTHEDVFMTGVVPAQINSNSNCLGISTEPIKIVDISLTVSYVFEHGRGDPDNFLTNFVRNTTMDIDMKNFESFRERIKKQIFFLISRSNDGLVNLRLWELIKKSASK